MTFITCKTVCEREKIRLKQENWKSEQIEQTAMSPCVPVVAMRGWNLNLCTYAIQLTGVHTLSTYQINQLNF